MGDLYLNEQTIMEELVGIVGMLGNQEGSTLKDIADVLESLHGPVRQDVIQGGLRTAVSSGRLLCKNRRYKVCEQNNILGNDSLFDLEGCSNYSAGGLRDADLRDDDHFSGTSLVAQVYDYLEGEPSCPNSEYYSVEEILSVKSIPSSGQLSAATCVNGIGSEGSLIDSKSKQTKRKSKKHLLVKMPFHKKPLRVENGLRSESAPGKSEDRQDITEQQEVTDNTAQTLCSSIIGDKALPVKKRSMTNVMNKVIRSFSEDNEAHVSKRREKGVVQELESSDGNKNFTNKDITEVMIKINNIERSNNIKASDASTRITSETGRKYNIEHADSLITPETVSKDENSESPSESLSGAISDVMKRITGREVPPELPENDEEPSIQGTSGNVRHEVQDGIETSNYKTSKPVKRGKRTKQNDISDTEDDVRYLTRSRAKAIQLQRSRLPSQCNSVTGTSSKKAKFS